MRRQLTGWGRTAPTMADVHEPACVPDVARAVSTVADEPHGRGVVARGLGRSYGDAAQNAGGLVLDTASLDAVRYVDAERGLAVADAGVSLQTLMRTLMPFGLAVPVLPGTGHVTVGGAIAADVHGKNHHVDGSFGMHVVSLELVTADGRTRTLAPDGPDERLFWATIGGMGLTGVVVRATISCHRVQTSHVVVDTERARDLEDLLGRLATGDAMYPYSVAWFDPLATGRRLGRGVVSRGRAAEVTDLPPPLAREPRRVEDPGVASVPRTLPTRAINGVTARAFNELWFRTAPATSRRDVQPMTSFFHPLDAVEGWNRLYGPRGFCQYQFVVPDGEEDALARAVELVRASGHVTCLNVLKRFGPGTPAPLSFPTRGWTVAMDFPTVPSLEVLFSRLDDLVLGAGGRVYLAKDSRLPPEALRLMYPRLEEFRAVRAEVDPEGTFRSDLARRLGL